MNGTSTAGHRMPRATARALACALFALAPSPILAQAPAPPAAGAPSPQRPGPAVPAPAPAECAIAAPSCFAGCGESQVRTAGGLCVPATAPGNPRAPDGMLAVMKPSAPAAASASASAPGERPCCHVRLEVEAVGFKNLGARAAKDALSSEVRINRQLVGRAPFADGLPAGDYYVEVVGPMREVHARMMLLRPGGHERLAARFSLPLDAQELHARDAYRRGRAERFQADARAERDRAREVERAELLRSEAAERAEFEREHAAWDERTRGLRAERSRKQTIGFISGGAGVVLVIAGGVMMVGASDAHDEAELASEMWRASTEEASQERWRERVDDALAERDLLQGLGLAGLGVGIAGLAVGCGFLLAVPAVEQEPVAPGQPPVATGSLRLAPWLAPGGLGVSVQLRR
jgi:hypothetical protein